MTLPATLQGRPFGVTQLTEIQSLLRQYPQASRYQLSRQVATLWNGRTAAGQLKDMAARTLLLKLHQQGLIQLPERRCASPTRSGRPDRRAGSWALDESGLARPLEPLQPLIIEEVSQLGRPERRAELEACLERYHYLGYRSRVGQNLQYGIRTTQGHPLAAVVFGAPAWQCAVRDRWIGWTRTQRAERLGWVLNNTRFSILPWVRVPHLASHLLGTINRRIAADWQTKYRQPLDLLETFVEGHKRGEPLGSGAIESTCRQMQCRMKRCGPFWSTAGDEALLCLEIFWRNDRWELLFPHVAITAVSRN
jgi:hypothetical protein